MRSASAATAWAEARTTYSPINFCMRFVLEAFDNLGTDDFPTATQGWRITQNKHTDRNPPRGAPVYFPNYGAGKSGHVAISLGGGAIRSSGINVAEVFTSSIAQIERLSGNVYAGWAADFYGRVIDFTSTAGGDSKPSPETHPDQGEGMRLTRDTDNNNAVVAGYALPPFWIRRGEVGANYDAIAANAASIYSENPNKFPGEVLNQLFADGAKANAQYRAQVSAPQFTTEQLAVIGRSVPVIDTAALVKLIDAADDDEHAALLAAVNKPRTIS